MLIRGLALLLLAFSICEATETHTPKISTTIWVKNGFYPGDADYDFEFTYTEPEQDYKNETAENQDDCSPTKPWTIIPLGNHTVSADKDWTTTEINRTLINAIPPHIFYQFCNLRTFIMTHQHLKEIHFENFENAKGVSHLNLSHNEIERIEIGTFDHVQKLAVLDLSFNRIEHIGEGVFRIPELYQIYLQGNKLIAPKWEQIMPLNAELNEYILNGNLGDSSIRFDKTETRRSYGYTTFSFSTIMVDISNNPLVFGFNESVAAENIDIQNFDVNHIVISPKTINLKASYNRITEASLEQFDKEFRLTSLNLTNNLLTTIPNLSNLQNLVVIDLSNNRIESIDDLPFAHKALQRIYLQNNRINSFALDNREILTQYTFTDSYSVLFEYNHKHPEAVYDLSGNPWLNSSAAVHVKADNVTLRNNRLEDLLISPEYVVLDAQDNRISKITVEFGASDNTYYRMTAMNLSHNLLTSASLSDSNLMRLDNLYVIDLSFNRITVLDESTLPVEALRHIYLQNNQIAILKWTAIIPDAAKYTLNDNSKSILTSQRFSRFTNSQYYYPSEDSTFTRNLDVSNNPFVNSTEASRIPADHLDLQNNRLHELSIFPKTVKLEAQNNRISKIVLEDDADQGFNLISLNLTNNQLTSISALAKLRKLEKIDLSGNRFETLNLTALSDLKHLRWISFKYNQLTRLSTGFAFNTGHLEYLDISYNRLVQFRLDGLFPQLQELHIEGNNLTQIDTVTKRKTPKLITFGLNDNYWDCNYLTKILLLIPFEEINLITDQPIVHTERYYSGSIVDIHCFHEVETYVEGIVNGPTQQTDINHFLNSVSADAVNSKLDQLKGEIVEMRERFIELNEKVQNLADLILDATQISPRVSSE